MHELFISVLFMFQMSLHTLGEKYFQKIISSYLSVAYSTLILQWSENILCMISILLSLLRLVLWPRISSIFGEANGNPLQYSCLEIPWTEEPGGLPSMGSHRVGHDWRDLAAAASWSILVYVPHTLENKVYSAVAGQCSVNVNPILLVEAGVEVWFSS